MRSTVANMSAGRPRPYRSPRGPRIPQLQYASHTPLTDKSNTITRLRQHAQLPQQSPTRHHLRLLPPRTRLLVANLPKTLPLDALLLRASLRRRHSRSATPVPRRHLPAAKLPRRSRRESRSLRSCLDCDDGCRHPLLDGYD